MEREKRKGREKKEKEERWGSKKEIKRRERERESRNQEEAPNLLWLSEEKGIRKNIGSGRPPDSASPWTTSPSCFGGTSIQRTPRSLVGVIQHGEVSAYLACR